MILSNLIYSIPLGIIYSIFIQKFGEMVFTNQKYLLFLFLAGVIGIILAQTIFTSNRALKNEIIKQGLIVGGIILILYSILTYWDKMTNETKLIILGIILGFSLWYSYHINKSK